MNVPIFFLKQGAAFVLPRRISTYLERIGIIQPRVARNELPWVSEKVSATLKGLYPIPVCLIQPLQGRRSYAYPGLNDRNPFRIAGTGDWA